MEHLSPPDASSHKDPDSSTRSVPSTSEGVDGGNKATGKEDDNDMAKGEQSGEVANAREKKSEVMYKIDISDLWEKE